MLRIQKRLNWTQNTIPLQAQMFKRYIILATFKLKLKRPLCLMLESNSEISRQLESNYASYLIMLNPFTLMILICKPNKIHILDWLFSYLVPYQQNYCHISLLYMPFDSLLLLGISVLLRHPDPFSQEEQRIDNCNKYLNAELSLVL